MGNAKKFEELLRSDEALQEKLRAAAEAYTGDASDEQAVFEAVVAPLAEEAGLPFTYEEAQKLASGSEGPSLDDLDAAAGGGGCFIFGGGDGKESCGSDRFGATACMSGGPGIGMILSS